MALELTGLFGYDIRDKNVRKDIDDINKKLETLGSGTSIDDTITSIEKTWSSNKINEQLNNIEQEVKYISPSTFVEFVEMTSEGGIFYVLTRGLTLTYNNKNYSVIGLYDVRVHSNGINYYSFTKMYQFIVDSTSKEVSYFTSFSEFVQSKIPSDASKLNIIDSNNNFTSDNVEGALEEVSTKFNAIANLSLTKHTDGKVYIKKQDGTLIGDGIEIGGSDVDLSKITMSISGQTLKLLNDGKQIATVEIPTAVVTDEQLTSIIQSKIDDGTLSTLTIEDNSLTPKKLAIWDIEDINLFNKDATDKVIDVAGNINTSQSTGFSTWSASNSSLSGYINTKPATIYYIDRALTSGNIQICEYDENKTPIKKATTATHKTNSDNTKCYVITTSETTKYIRFIYSNSLEEQLMVTENAYIENYIDYTEKEYNLNVLGKNFRNKLNKNYKITEENIDEEFITPNMTNFCFSDDLNLVDCDNYMECQNTYMNLYFSNYFRVTNRETLYANIPFYSIYYYDENKNLLLSVAGEKNSSGSQIQKEITIDCDNVYYARIVYPLTHYTNKSIMVTRYKGEQDEYKDFSTKWFTLDDKYKEYFVKNVLNVPTFSKSVKDILLPYVSPTAGKSLIAFGDSLMQYSGGDGSTGYGFFTQVNKYLNMDMHNLGYAGSNWTGSGTGDCKARINKLISEGICYDVVLLGWGTNADADLGTIEDEPSDSGSMCAVIKWAVQQIRTNFPHSGLGIILPPPGISGGSESKVNLIKTCCEHESMHVPYLDLFHSANITKTPIKTGGLADDQVHLGEHGRNRYASVLRPFIEMLTPCINRYSFTYNLTNVTSDKNYKWLSEKTSITITLTANEGYTLDDSSVIVTIGGVDVTNDVYSNGTITINMTGDIVITASATQNS